MWTFERFIPHPVVHLPQAVPVYDLRQKSDILLADQNRFGIGRYNEDRQGMYQTPLFEGGRSIHLGIDFFGPIGTPVFAFAKGRIHLFGYNSAPGDYGCTLVTEHLLGSTPLYSLYGHLSQCSLKDKYPGQEIAAGEILGWMGDRHENGGWTPHLHFQLGVEKPLVPDMPGVIERDGLLEALHRYPDPRIVLGPIYL